MLASSALASLDVLWRVLIPLIAFCAGFVAAQSVKRTGGPVVRTVATKTIAEIAEKAATAVAQAVSAGSIVVAPLVGSISKDLVEALLSRTSEVERKLEKLLREPLRTALLLLTDAAGHATDSPKAIESRDKLLDAAHNSFSRALALCGDSREDTLFIRALDCIGVAEQTGRSSLAASYVKELDTELADLFCRVEALERDAAEWEQHVEEFNKFLGRDDLGEKPTGYAELLAMAKRREKQARKVRAEAEAARFRFEILQNLVTLAKASLGRADANANSSKAAQAPLPASES